MARYILTTAAQVAFVNYLQPGRVHVKGQTVDLSPAEVTALGAGNMRAVATATVHDQQGEAVGVSNGS
jgi:hypothetical protein